jgi:hypothetical protein
MTEAKGKITKARKPKKPPPATLPEGQPFTQDFLRDLLRDKVLRKRQTMPDDADIKELVRILNVWRNHYTAINVDIRAKNELIKLEQQALDTLSTVLPQLQKGLIADIKVYSGHKGTQIITAAKTKRLAEIECLMTCVRVSKKSRFWTTFWEESTLPDRRKKWADLQDALCTDFENAMKRANPDMTFGLSNDGPHLRFIAAVIPSITGESIKSSYVGWHRKRAAAKKIML